MSLADAFSGHEALYRSQVMAQTWGHLAPEAGKRYSGTILFTQTEYGQLVPIRSDFKDLPDSPWFFEHLNDFVANEATVPGAVCRFRGTYVTFKNGNHRFTGKITTLDC